MPEFEMLDTMLVINPSLARDIVGRETLVATGSARGMTSVVAYALYEAGLFLGDRIHKRSFEDMDFRAEIPGPKGAARPIGRHARLAALVEERNARFDRWGVKLPRLADYVADVPGLFRRPLVILCVRNQVAVCRSVMRRHPGVVGGLQKAFDNSMMSLSAMSYLLSTEELPSLILDMDAVRRDPETFLREFYGFLQLSGDLPTLSEKISTPGYAMASPRNGVELVI